MRTTFNLVLPILLFIQIIQCGIGKDFKKDELKDAQTIKDSTKVSFNIFPKEIESKKRFKKNESEINAEIKHTNLNKEKLKLTKLLFIGLESEGDNFIEAFDFQENKIEIEKEIHYQIPFDLNYENPYFDEVKLKNNETKIDTVNLSVFYEFKEKGIYKVRFVNKELNLTSNWDTLKVN